MLTWGRTKSDQSIDLRDVSVGERFMDAERIAYLHVGAHKTATTSLQNLIRENAIELYHQGVVPLARGFPLTPQFPQGLSYQRNFIALLRKGVSEIAMGGKPRSLRKVRKLMALLTADAPQILVSEEGLLGRRLGVETRLYPQARFYARALTRVFPQHRPVVIVYIRRQSRFIESNYVHSVKTGDPRTFRQFVDSLNFDRMYWSPLIEGLCRKLGTESVIVRPFESIRNGFVPFATEFFEIFSDATRMRIRDVAANPGLSSVGVTVSSFLAPRVGKQAWGLLRQPVQRVLSNRRLPGPQLFSAEEREALDARFEQDYQSALSLARWSGRPMERVRSG